MEEKKRYLKGLVGDAIKNIKNNQQKTTNNFSNILVKKEKPINSQKSTDFNYFNKKNDLNKDSYIKWFSELSNNNINIAGGKGASLGEMFNNKFPVPPGYVITTKAFNFFMEKGKLKEKIKNILNVINIEETNNLQKASNQIRKLIEEVEIPKELEDEILEAYHILGAEKIEEKGISQDALNILKNSKEPIFVSVRSSATTEDLMDASFAGQQESFLNIKGDKKLIEYIKKCFSSLYTARAIYYRKKKGFKNEDALLAVIIQKMIDSDKSGVIFSKDPINLTDDIVIEAIYGLGEGIVSGKINPDHYISSRELKIKSIKKGNKKIAIVRTSSGNNEIVRLNTEKSKSQVLTNGQILEITNIAIRLEEHYKKPQDIEFAIENNKVYIIQSRPITTLSQKKENYELEGNIILRGRSASPGIGIGTVRIIKSTKDLDKIKKGDVLVTEMTNPDMVVSMQKSVAIVTDEGGMTSHAAIVSREMGIPAVVGAENATSILKEGMKITVDGSNGKIYEGEILKAKKTEIKQAVHINKIKLKLIVDLPEFAERASQSGINAIGLTRIEGIIAGSKKHPLLYEKNNTLNEYTELLKRGINKILKPFKSMWIRTSDIRTDEYSSLQGAPEKEINPMLGFHGIRFSLKHPKILEAELKAIKSIAEENSDKEIGIMFPQIMSIEEVKKAKNYFNKFKTSNMKFGVMIETPACVQIINEICKEVDFVSFGTNDLTQFTLGVDRGNENVQYLYNDLHPSIFSQIKKVINVCRREKIETSICGQAGSKKEMVEFLFRKGINSISVNADAAYEISNFIKELEENWEKFKSINFKKSNEFNEVNFNKSKNKNLSKYELRKQKKRERNKLRRKRRREKLKQLKKEKNKSSLPSILDKKIPNINNYQENFENKNDFGNKIKISEKINHFNNIGPIEPFNNMDRIENKAEGIKEKINEKNLNEIDDNKEIEDDIKITEELSKKDSPKKDDYIENIGVYEPEKKEEQKNFEYNFDDED